MQTYLCRYHILTTILNAHLNGEHVYMIHRVSMPGLEPMATRSQPQAQGVVYELVYIIKNNGPDAKWHGGVAKCCSRAAKCYGLPSH